MPYDGEYFEVSLTVCTVLLDSENKIYMTCRKNVDWQNGSYDIPGGKVERHESFLQAAIREVKEEAGVDVRPEDMELFLIQNSYWADVARPDWVNMFFVTKKWQGTPVIAEPEKCSHSGWYKPDDSSITVIPNIRAALMHLDAPRPAFSTFEVKDGVVQERIAA